MQKVLQDDYFVEFSEDVRFKFFHCSLFCIKEKVLVTPEDIWSKSLIPCRVCRPLFPSITQNVLSEYKQSEDKKGFIKVELEILWKVISDISVKNKINLPYELPVFAIPYKIQKFLGDFFEKGANESILYTIWDECWAEGIDTFAVQMGMCISVFEAWINYKKTGENDEGMLKENGERREVWRLLHAIEAWIWQSLAFTFPNKASINNLYEEIKLIESDIDCVVFIDGDNAAISIDKLVFFPNNSRFLVVFTSVTKSHPSNVFLVLQKRWFVSLQSETNVKNAVDHSMGFQVGFLTAILPKRIKFILVSNDNFAKELKKTITKFGRECYIVGTELYRGFPSVASLFFTLLRSTPSLWMSHPGKEIQLFLWEMMSTKKDLEKEITIAWEMLPESSIIKQFSTKDFITEIEKRVKLREKSFKEENRSIGEKRERFFISLVKGNLPCSKLLLSNFLGEYNERYFGCQNKQNHESPQASECVLPLLASVSSVNFDDFTNFREEINNLKEMLFWINEEASIRAKFSFFHSFGQKDALPGIKHKTKELRMTAQIKRRICVVIIPKIAPIIKNLSNSEEMLTMEQCGSGVLQITKTFTKPFYMIFWFIAKPWTTFWNDCNIEEPEDSAQYSLMANWISYRLRPIISKWKWLITTQIKSISPEELALLLKITHEKSTLSLETEKIIPEEWRVWLKINRLKWGKAQVIVLNMLEGLKIAKIPREKWDLKRDILNYEFVDDESPKEKDKLDEKEFVDDELEKRYARVAANLINRDIFENCLEKKFVESFEKFFCNVGGRKFNGGGMEGRVFLLFDPDLLKILLSQLRKYRDNRFHSYKLGITKITFINPWSASVYSKSFIQKWIEHNEIKPCHYFFSDSGCRRGDGCIFKHTK